VIRLACLLALVSLITLFPVCFDLSGSSAILFVFVGFPTLFVALMIYAAVRWRAGAFRVSETSRLR